MTLEQIKHLYHLAKLNGIKTCRELVEYKQANNIQTNSELFQSLYKDAKSKIEPAV